MSQRVIYHQFDPAKNRYFVDEKEVTEDEYRSASKKHTRQLLRECSVPGGHLPAAWPAVSDAMLTQPAQQREMQEAAAKKGIELQFNHLGQAVLNDRNHRRQCCEFFGMTDRNAGYGDRVGDNLNG